MSALVCGVSYSDLCCCLFVFTWIGGWWVPMLNQVFAWLILNLNLFILDSSLWTSSWRWAVLGNASKSSWCFVFLDRCTRIWSQSKGISSRLTKCLPGLKYCPCLVHALETPSVLLPSLLTENGNCILVVWGFCVVVLFFFFKCLYKLTDLVIPLFLLAMRVGIESILGLCFEAQDVLDGFTFYWRDCILQYPVWLMWAAVSLKRLDHRKWLRSRAFHTLPLLGQNKGPKWLFDPVVFLNFSVFVLHSIF